MAVETIQDKLGDGRGPTFIIPHKVEARVSVGREGELVVLRFGTTVIRLHWKDALRVGMWTCAKAHEAKVLAGEMGKPFEVGPPPRG